MLAKSPFGRGWYAVATTEELPVGGVLARRCQGRDVVVFRTESGAVLVLDAHCPHLGAHMGHGGEVKGETIRCHFHGFCFDAAGACTETGYGTKPPPTARVGAWPVREVGGLVMAWFEPARAAPDFELPEVLAGPDWHTPLVTTWKFRGNPQDIAENSVDLGHLQVTHRYIDPHPTAELVSDRVQLEARYRFTRADPVLPSRTVTVDIHIRQAGLGFALVDSVVAPYRLRTQLLVASTAADETNVELRCAVIPQRIKRSGDLHPLLTPVPAAIVNHFVRKQALSAFRNDVNQHVPIWDHKKHLDRTALAAGDGPIGRYRKWAVQFYSEPPPAKVTPLRTSSAG
jgi:nitrite reductase/ring-hydroxylating ferredoxin subunit